MSGRRKDKEEHPSPDPREGVFAGSLSHKVKGQRSMYDVVCDSERASISGAGRELGAFVVVLERETRLEVEAFTTLALAT